MVACQSAPEAPNATIQNTYDPMLDANSIVASVAGTEKWECCYMWHPGQLAAWQQAWNLASSKARCINVGYPGSYYKKSTDTWFKRQVSFDKDTPLKWTGSGTVTLTVDGQSVDAQQSSYTVPAGQHELVFYVQTTDHLPALMIDGQNPADWQASTDGTTWHLTESDARFCYADVLPDARQEVGVTVAPRSYLVQGNATEKNGVLTIPQGSSAVVDFYYLELGNISMTAQGDGELAFTVGETVQEAMNQDQKQFEQFPIPSMKVSGQQHLELPENALRYLNIQAVSGDIEISDIQFTALMWPVQFQMQFNCDDQELNQLFQAGIATQHTCIHNFYLDGVKRDFLPWAMDAVVSSMGGDYAFGEQQISRNGISIALMPEHATQQDLGVIDYPLHALIGLRQEYLRYGDLRTSLMFRDRIEGQLSVFEKMQDERGFITAIDNGWGFIPGWDIQNGPEHAGIAAYAQMLLMENFRIAAQFAGLWNEPALAKHYTEKAEQLKSSIVDAFWDAERHAFINGFALDGSRDERLSHHTQYWSVLTGLYPEDDYETLFTQVYPSIPNYEDNVSYEKGYEAIAFARAGYSDRFIQTLKNVWGAWLKKGHTRYPENFQIHASEAQQLEFYHRQFGLSLCHGANGVPPITTIVFGLMGMEQQMQTPGQYTFTPNLYSLKHFQATIPVHEGIITMKVDGETCTVSAPKECKVKVDNRYIPNHKIVVNQ